MDPIFMPLESQQKNRSSLTDAIERYLTDKIDFAGRYLALGYFHFYDTIHNVTEENDNNIVKYMAPSNDNIFEIHMPSGTYSFRDYDNFTHYIMRNNNHYLTNEKTKTETFGISFVVNPVYNVISVRIVNGYKLIIDRDGTSVFLGIRKGIYTEDFNGEENPNITMNNDMLFVHCNLLANSLVPEFSDVLFTCPINQKFGQHVTVIPNEKRYLKCANTSTQIIKMHLTNQDGKGIKLVEAKWGLGLDIK